MKSTSAYLVLTIEDASESELRDWFSIMSHQCVNTGNNRVFGQPLAFQLGARRFKPYRVPPVVTQSIAFIDQYGLEMEGLFRLSGNSHEVSGCKEKYDCGDNVVFDKELSPHVPANLLKAWCRELPEPLVPFKLYPGFLYACNRHGAFHSSVLNLFCLTLLCAQNLTLQDALPQSWHFLTKCHRRILLYCRRSRPFCVA